MLIKCTKPGTLLQLIQLWCTVSKPPRPPLKHRLWQQITPRVLIGQARIFTPPQQLSSWDMTQPPGRSSVFVISVETLYRSLNPLTLLLLAAPAPKIVKLISALVHYQFQRAFFFLPPHTPKALGTFTASYTAAAAGHLHLVGGNSHPLHPFNLIFQRECKTVYEYDYYTQV